jgi:hypothetical protein
VLPSSCGIAIADSKKSCACPPLLITQQLSPALGAISPHHSVQVILPAVQLLRTLQHTEHDGPQAQVEDVDEQQRDPALYTGGTG